MQPACHRFFFKLCFDMIITIVVEGRPKPFKATSVSFMLARNQARHDTFLLVVFKSIGQSEIFFNYLFVGVGLN